MENKICVYAICKNESKFVEQWLNSMSEADYIVVLDTGSEDATFEMLRNDSRVYRAEQAVITPWRFDVARNESMKLIPDDANILVCTDLDELLEPGWADILRANWVDGVHERCVYKYAWSHNPDGSAARVFQYDKIHNRDWVWNFPVHECLVRPYNLLEGTYASEHTLMLFDYIYLHHYPDSTKSRSTYLPLLEIRKHENPCDYYSKLYLAHEYYYNGKYEESIAELCDILDNHRANYTSTEQASCFLFMGDSYKQLNDLGNAIICYQKGILADPTYRECYVNLAQALLEMQYYDQAIGVIKQCFRSSYRHYIWLERDASWTYEPYDILAIAYYYLEDYDASLNNVVKAIHYNPTNEQLLTNLALIEQKLFKEVK